MNFEIKKWSFFSNFSLFHCIWAARIPSRMDSRATAAFLRMWKHSGQNQLQLDWPKEEHPLDLHGLRMLS